MVLDMDGVLYKNAGVESDIVQRLGKATQELGLGPEAHQHLFKSYGSTIQGRTDTDCAACRRSCRILQKSYFSRTAL